MKDKSWMDGMTKDEKMQAALESMIRLEKAGRGKEVLEILNRREKLIDWQDQSKQYEAV